MIVMQENHWWFRARRKILFSILKKHISSGNCSILEIGCGTGGNLSMLKKLGQVSAMEMNEFSVNYASKNNSIPVKTGWLPDNIPFTKKFDVICLFDVLEHIQNDQAALKAAIKMLNPGGIIMLTIPAHKWLFGSHDKMHNHYRRYSSKDLKKKIAVSGIKLIRLSHFNFLLFPVLMITRAFDLIVDPETALGYSTPNKILNTILYSVFSLEKYLINKISLPFGGSVFAIVKNKF